ncbi:MAG: hypothetical protein RR382_06000 [Tannerellaceae bacterium]
MQRSLVIKNEVPEIARLAGSVAYQRLDGKNIFILKKILTD